MRLLALPSFTFYLCLFLAAVQSISPQLPVAASTPPSALSASPATITSTPDPELTPPPSPEDVNVALEDKWHLTTFYTCITIAEQVHCGWREPVLPGGTEIAEAPRPMNREMAGMAIGALVVAGLLI